MNDTILNYPVVDKTLQINSILRIIGSLEFRVSIMHLRKAQSEFTSSMAGIEKIKNALAKVGINSSISQLDVNYYFTSWDTWQKIIEVLNPIAQNFNWEPELFDCDNRANLMSALVSLMFRINTCVRVYCDVFGDTTGKYRYTHYCNLIIDNNDNVYLWDVDYGGMSQKITSSPVIMGKCKYVIYSIIAG